MTVLLTAIFTTEIAAIKLDSFSFWGMRPTVLTGYCLGIGRDLRWLVAGLLLTPLMRKVELAN